VVRSTSSANSSSASGAESYIGTTLDLDRVHYASVS
jgi:hypothetical protein